MFSPSFVVMSHALPRGVTLTVHPVTPSTESAIVCTCSRVPNSFHESTLLPASSRTVIVHARLAVTDWVPILHYSDPLIDPTIIIPHFDKKVTPYKKVTLI